MRGSIERALRHISADDGRAKRAFGYQEVEQAVEVAKQREQAEKARKRPRRSRNRDGRREKRAYSAHMLGHPGFIYRTE